MSKQHSELGASKADRWMNCPGSVRMERGLSESASPYALEGTVAHWLAERAILDRVPCLTFLGTEKHGIEITEDMCEAVQQYVDVVNAQVATDRKARLSVERKFSLAVLNPPAPMFGSSDAVVYLPKQQLLIVNDLKYGRGVMVEPQDNPQLLYYALGAVLDMERDANMRGQIDTVRVVIVQPRISHVDGCVRSYDYAYLDVVAFAVRLLALAHDALQPDAPLVPGEHCRFCKAAGACPALKAQAVAIARVEFDDLPVTLPPAPATLPLPVLAEILDKADLLEDWLKSVRQFVIAQLETGAVVPGWKLVNKRATRKWVSPALTEEWAAAAGINPDELRDEPKLLSPAQTEKQVLKALGVKLPEHLVSAVSSGVTLAPDTDPRPVAAIGPAHDFPEDVPDHNRQHDKAA